MYRIDKKTEKRKKDAQNKLKEREKKNRCTEQIKTKRKERKMQRID